jgi:6-phosphofructokinase
MAYTLRVEAVQAVGSVPILEAMGIRVVEVRPGYAAAELPPEPNVNHFGVTYAGSLFSVAEMLGGVLCLATFDLEGELAGFVPLVKESTIRFRRPALGVVRATASLSADEVARVRADALATGSYFIVETMGRKAGWLSYGVAIAGEANLVLAVEDVRGALATEEHGEVKLSLEALVDRIVDLIITRERRGKHYGTIVLAEGLAEMLPTAQIRDLPRDEHGHISLGRIDLGKLVAQRVMKRYEEKTRRKKKATGLQLGYESRCAPPHAFDVMLGSQLGIGAYRALVEENLDGHMVSIQGQLDLRYVPFKDLINPQTLKTEVRFIPHGSDYHRLARFLETRTDKIVDWSPGRRSER